MRTGTPIRLLTDRVRTSVAPGQPHLESLLHEAQEAIDRGRRDLAVTHLAQAVLVAARTPERTVDQVALQRRVREIIGSGGGLA